MKKVSLTIIGILIIGGLGWLAILNRTAPEASNRQSSFERAPDFALQDYHGRTVQRTDFAGKPLVVNAWAAWCPFCGKELVDFAMAQKEFGDDVVIIAIDRAESREIAKPYTDALGVTDDVVFLLDPLDSFYHSIGGFAMPETIFVDKDGDIVEHKRGPMELPEMRRKIQTLLSS